MFSCTVAPLEVVTVAVSALTVWPVKAALLRVKTDLTCLPNKPTTRMAATATTPRMMRYSVMAMPSLLFLPFLIALSFIVSWLFLLDCYLSLNRFRTCCLTYGKFDAKLPGHHSHARGIIDFARH